MQVFRVHVERVRVLHQEFARAHHAEARTTFVSELGLHPIEVDRQLAIAAEVLTEVMADHFLMRRTKAEVIHVAILEEQHLGAHLIPASARKSTRLTSSHKCAHRIQSSDRKQNTYNRYKNI